MSIWPRLVLVAATAIASASLSGAFPPTPEPPPRFLVVKDFESKTATFVYWKDEVVFREVVRDTIIDGQTKKVASTMAFIEARPREFAVKLSDLSAVTASGKTIAGVKPWKDLVGKSVLMVDPKKPIDPVYKAALAPDTVLVTLEGPMPPSKPASSPESKQAAETSKDPAPTNPTNNPATNPPMNPAPTPAQINIAIKALQPILKQRNIMKPPAPIQDPDLAQAFPGAMIFPVPTPNNEDNDNDLVIVQPDGTTNLANSDDTVWDLLKNYPPPRTDAEIRRYMRVHLLLVEARHPRYQYGVIGPINITARAKGGKTAYGEAPIIGGGNANRRPAALTLTVNFSDNGRRLGGQRGVRAQ